MPYSKRQLSSLLKADLLPASRVPHLATRAAETVVKRSVFKVEDAAVRAQAALYRAALADLRAQAHHFNDLGFSNKGWRDAMIAFATTRLSRLTDDAAAAGLRAAVAAYQGGYAGRLWLLDMATREDVRIHLPRANALDAVLREDFYDTLIRELLGREWRDRYALELDDLVLTIRRALGMVLVEGEGVDAAMRRVAEAMGVPTDRRFGRVGSRENATYRANFSRVQALTRTVIQTQANSGAIAAYAANADILSGYQWLTARDERVCPTCRGLDGTTYKFNDSYRPPAHPSCRCSVIPTIAPDALERADARPRQTFAEWLRGYGMEPALADFLTPPAA